MHEDPEPTDIDEAPGRPLLGLRLWEVDPPAVGTMASTPDHPLAARNSLVGRRLRALRQVILRMRRAVRDAPNRSPAWLDELATANGRLRAADGYIDLRDLPVDVSPN